MFITIVLGVCEDILYLQYKKYQKPTKNLD